MDFEPAEMREFLTTRGTAIAGVHLLPGGRCNSNYLVELRDGTRVVARQHAQPVMVEHVALERARTLGIPVPEVLATTPHTTILSYLPGKQLAQAPDHYRAAARMLARIHSLRFDRPGWLTPTGTEPFEFGPGGYLATTLAHPTVQAWTGDRRLQRLKKMLLQQQSLVDEMRTEATLTHGDYNPTNVLVADGEVTAVLDWEYTHVGSLYLDLGNLMRRQPARDHSDEVVQGLRDGGIDVPGDWRARAMLSDLSAMVEFLNSSHGDMFKQLCVQRIEDTLVFFGH